MKYMKAKREPKVNVLRDSNTICIYQMNHPHCVSDFIRVLHDGQQRGYEEFVIKSKLEFPSKQTHDAVFPNACVPIAGILQYYQAQGVNFEFDFKQDEYLLNSGFTNPFYVPADEIKRMPNPFDKIFRYDNSRQVSEYTQKYVDSISHQIVCEPGVIDSLVWCINEAMDNVLTHSGCDSGYVMAQLHDRNKHVAICISDTGMGIYNSLKGSVHRPKSAVDAISLAIQEGIGDGQGQGNGLFGLYKIVLENGGRLSITSGSASLMLQHNKEMKKFDRLPIVNDEHPGTIVDFQIDLGKEVSLSNVFSSIGGFDGFDFRLDDYMVQEDRDALLYDVFENCQGTATREAGRLLRNDVLNIINRRKTAITLDFSKVATVSSSFIDELVAKMVLQLGLLQFNQMIAIKGMNDTVRYLCERSVYMRINEEWNRKDTD